MRVRTGSTQAQIDEVRGRIESLRGAIHAHWKEARVRAADSDLVEQVPIVNPVL